jgi:hypothetical protein
MVDKFVIAHLDCNRERMMLKQFISSW